MIQVNGVWQRTYQNAIGRWAGVGPYYAMFPNEFAFEVVEQFTEPGDWVLDPFAGRFSSSFAAVSQGRSALGIEINPVGWVYGETKLNPAPHALVESRLREIAERGRFFGERSLRVLPEFFHYCYSRPVLSFLLAARRHLDWKGETVDRTLMAILLIHLHAKLGSGLSNQMRQSKSMAPEYSVRWWKARNMSPPELDPLEFMLHKIRWRYDKGLPEVSGESRTILGDSTQELEHVCNDVLRKRIPRFRLLVTSPPYHSVTHYHYDQWLRLWMLGGPSWPSKVEDENRGRFGSRERYTKLLDSVFGQSAKAMCESATVYVRTDKRQFTLETTRAMLKRHFTGWDMCEIERPYRGKTQTTLFGDKSDKPGEVDIILRR